MIFYKSIDIIRKLIKNGTIMLNPDWSFLIRSLNENCLTEKQIAEYVGLAQPAINQIKNGKYGEPKYQTALRILELCEKHNIHVKQKNPVATNN